jgi:hypothetical protein
VSAEIELRRKDVCSEVLDKVYIKGRKQRPDIKELVRRNDQQTRDDLENDRKVANEMS